jgi:gamma-glutamylcyclotransferase
MWWRVKTKRCVGEKPLKDSRALRLLDPAPKTADAGPIIIVVFPDVAGPPERAGAPNPSRTSSRTWRSVCTVMSARAAHNDVGSSPRTNGVAVHICAPTLYFGYGSNLWLEQMATRCPRAVYRGIARLVRHRWIINGRGFANIVPGSKNDVVYGLLYMLQPDDETSLDISEGVALGSYEKQRIMVELWPAAGETWTDVLSTPPERIEALVYVDVKYTNPSKPRREYVRRMNSGIEDAARLGVPPAYIEDVMRPFIPTDGEIKVSTILERVGAPTIRVVSHSLVIDRSLALWLVWRSVLLIERQNSYRDEAQPTWSPSPGSIEAQDLVGISEDPWLSQLTERLRQYASHRRLSM